jgi:predicted NAD/FAD-binding protein
VTLFERNDYAGGHTHTIVLDKGPDAGTPVDTGFIVMNHRNYPVLTRLFDLLGVELRDSDMSFGYWDRASGLQYCGSSLNGLFARRRNLVSPAFLRMVADVLRFYRRARRDLAAGCVPETTLGAYLASGGYGEAFLRHHLVPMGAAIWSTPCMRMLEFPAASFLRFCDNHGLLSVGDRPQWRTVVGGSHQYVRRMLERFGGTLRLNACVAGVTRRDGRVQVATKDGGSETFDGVVIAAHADEALRMLGDASADEQRLLGAWTYQPNRTALHTDARVMPSLARACASWNYVRAEGDGGGDGEAATLSYDMNRLQGLRTQGRYFVSLNRPDPFAPGSVIADMTYMHPTYTQAAWDTQQALAGLNGTRNTWFCGSYFGYGFHEDAVRSAAEVGRAFGETL